jgi:hypothetical protein
MDNINAQPHTLMNEIRSILKDKWEYVRYNLSYREFKSQINVYLKNRCHVLQLLIEAWGGRLDDYLGQHWENIERFIALEAKQEEET